MQSPLQKACQPEGDRVRRQRLSAQADFLDRLSFVNRCRDPEVKSKLLNQACVLLSVEGGRGAPELPKVSHERWRAKEKQRAIAKTRTVVRRLNAQAHLRLQEERAAFRSRMKRLEISSAAASRTTAAHALPSIPDLIRIIDPALAYELYGPRIGIGRR